MKKNIFERSLAGEPVNQMTEEDGHFMDEAQEQTRKITARLNTGYHDETEVRDLLRRIGVTIHETGRVRPPFHTDFGRFISIGRNVFINELCEFMDRGGITIDDDVFIGPRVNLITENHDLAPDRRLWLISRPIHIGKNVWIGAAATVLPGVTIGENAVVAAGSVVTRDVPPGTVVAGNPAKVIRTIKP